MWGIRRELQAQQSIQDLIARDEPLSGTLLAICELTNSMIPSSLSKVMLFDAESQTLRFAAGNLLPEACQQDMRALPIGPDEDICCRAAFLKQLVVSEDVRHDSFSSVSHEFIEQNGLRACWAYPVLSRERVLLGTFAVFYRVPGPPSRREIDLMSRATALVALAIERDEARQAHRITQQRYQSLFTCHPDGVFSLDLTGHVEEVNPAGLALTGYTRDALLGQHFSRFVVAEDLPRVDKAFRNAVKGKQQQYDIRAITADGNIYPVTIINLPIIVNEDVVGVYGIARKA